MKTFKTILTSIIDICLIFAALPLIMTFCGFSLMMFDAPEAIYMFKPWAIVIAAWGGAILVLSVAIIGAVRKLLAERMLKSILYAALPMVVYFGLFTILHMM